MCDGTHCRARDSVFGKIGQTWAKLHYLAIVVLERWYVCARASFACPNGLQHFFCVRENHRTCIRRSLYSRGKNRSVRCNIKLKHALTSSPINKRNSASQCCPLINYNVAQNMSPCSCKHLPECDVRACTAAIRPNYPTSNHFVVESYSTGAKHTRIPGACYSFLHVSGCADK